MSDSTSRPGRRAAPSGPARRVGPLDVLAIVIPLLTVGAISLVSPVVDDATTRPPAEVSLTRTTLVCPAALPGAGTVSVASATGGSGEVTTRLPAEDTLTLDGTARVATGRPWCSRPTVTSPPGSSPAGTARAPRRPATCRARSSGSPGWARRPSTPRSSSSPTPTVGRRSPT